MYAHPYSYHPHSLAYCNHAATSSTHQDTNAQATTFAYRDANHGPVAYRDGQRLANGDQHCRAGRGGRWQHAGAKIYADRRATFE